MKPKKIFLDTLIRLVQKYNWELFEWVILENHYHFLAKVNLAQNISIFFNTLHKTTAFHIKKLLNIDVKPFWYQYWDKCIRDEKQYFETATYIMYNPVKHNYVTNLNDYEFSSFHLNKNEDEEGLRKTFLAYKPHSILYYNEIDDF